MCRNSSLPQLSDQETTGIISIQHWDTQAEVTFQLNIKESRSEIILSSIFYFLFSKQRLGQSQFLGSNLTPSLKQGSTDYFFEGSDSIYIRLRGSYRLLSQLRNSAIIM